MVMTCDKFLCLLLIGNHYSPCSWFKIHNILLVTPVLSIDFLLLGAHKAKLFATAMFLTCWFSCNSAKMFLLSTCKRVNMPNIHLSTINFVIKYHWPFVFNLCFNLAGQDKRVDIECHIVVFQVTVLDLSNPGTT